MWSDSIVILFVVFGVMILRPTRSTRTGTLLPYTTLCRSTRCGRWRICRLCRVATSHACKCRMCRSRAPERWRNDYAEERLWRSEEHTSELQSLMRISYAVFCLQKKIQKNIKQQPNTKYSSYTHTNYQQT